jgi:hypothetical protein
MMEMLKWGVAAMLLTLFATAQASADGDNAKWRDVAEFLPVLPRNR